MSTYDSWLLSGSDDAPPCPPSPSEIRRAVREARPFQMEGYTEEIGTDGEGWPLLRWGWVYHLDRRYPQNAKARRLQARMFRRIVRQMGRRAA